MIPKITDLETLARQAGALLRGGFMSRPGFSPSLEISYKGEIDLVTEMDHRSEDYLVGEIQRSFPDHGIITEERGLLNWSQGHQWFLDPLDGTVNYAHGVPIYSVSVAYAEHGQVILGAVYDPMQDECFSAQRGQGAWLNGEPIRVSAMRELRTALLVTGFPYDIRTNPDNNLDNYTRFSIQAQAVRRLGSAAMDLCYVAAGRFEGFWEIRINSWDIAAGGLIVEEAGGVVTNLHGDQRYLTAPFSVVAANPAIHPLMLEILNAR